MTGVEIVNLTVDAFSITLDTTTSLAGFGGLTTLSTTNTGAAQTIKTAATVDVTVNGSAQAATAIAVDGGKAVTVNTTGVNAAGGTIAVGGTTAATAAKGAVVISDTDQAMANGVTAGTIAVNGGTTVSVTQLNGGSGLAVNQTATQGAVSVTGTADTTKVSVIQSGNVTAEAASAASANSQNVFAGLKGNVAGAVTIADLNAGTQLAATITEVTLQNYGVSTISSNKLATLTLSGTGVSGAGTALTTGTLGLTDGLTTPTVTALALNLGGGFLGTINDASNKFVTVNANMTASTKLNAFTDTALKTLAISGTGVLTLVNTNAALTSVTVTGAAGFSGSLVGTGVTSFTAANTTANNTVALTATSQSYTGGTGNDKVTITADATQVITGGSGVDTLALGAVAGATFTLANTGTKVTGFETLATNLTTGIVDMSLIGGSAFNKIEVSGNSTTAFSKVTAGTALALKAATTAIVYQTSDTAGATDSVAVTLSGIAAAAGTGTIGYITTALTLADANSVGIGSVSIATDATVGGGFHTITTLTDSALSNLAITGTGALVITNAATTATSLTISDNDTSTGVSKITSLTSTGDVLGNLSYSGSHAFTITTLTDAVANATITNANTGTSGVLTITNWTDANLVNLTLNGSVAITTGVSTFNGIGGISGATDDQNVGFTMAGGGVKTITLGNGANTIVTGAAADVITLGTGINDVNAAAGADKVTFGADTNADTYRLKAAAGAGGLDTGTFAVPGTNTISTTAFDIVTGLSAGDKIQLLATAYTGIAGAAAGLIANGNAYTSDSAVALVDNGIEIVRGTYDSTAKTFVGSATGADSLFIYDADATIGSEAHEAIVAVGYVALSVAGIGGNAGTITLA